MYFYEGPQSAVARGYAGSTPVYGNNKFTKSYYIGLLSVHYIEKCFR